MIKTSRNLLLLNSHCDLSRHNDMIYGRDSVNCLGNHPVNNSVSLTIPQLNTTLQRVLYLQIDL